VKNAVIVPTGAKGGFYPKQLPDPAQNRDAWAAEGRAFYQIFVRSCSLTDNIGGQVVPAGMVRDGKTPISWSPPTRAPPPFRHRQRAGRRGAFLAGRCLRQRRLKGYDHKAMGITARGG
jgi:glutamate dehydrogenase